MTGTMGAVLSTNKKDLAHATIAQSSYHCPRMPQLQPTMQDFAQPWRKVPEMISQHHQTSAEHPRVVHPVLQEVQGGPLGNGSRAKRLWVILQLPRCCRKCPD
eukprot:CAMPEP_0172685390 /NCGR_PEP_ID=MMETSP1074-20121228/20205_1 /TAXON_ID=2916 /ORGANISM="Ceratium fusus, Strain PA161109" /LENGTH=102 /DNA_ID=CAMNT_0013504523 /DNA_START=42 /DNA_END=350 /DNA_ORIENTATION=+